MNFLENYYNINDDEIVINAKQGSDFAKVVANDFNPIHNTDAKRFCVPGDLLFAIALNQYGLHTQMKFQFRELVKADISLTYPPKLNTLDSVQIEVVNSRDKTVLDVLASGKSSKNSKQLEQLIKNYVAFSGQNFPHILVPLMKQHNVMINPSRPLVIYENMSLNFDTLDFTSIDIALEDASLSVNGKRGDTKLYFVITSKGKKVGSGIKSLVLSGLREYEQSSIDQMCQEYAHSVSTAKKENKEL